MRSALFMFNAGSRSLSYFLGLTVITLAVAVQNFPLGATGVAGKALETFGMTFLGLLAGLVFLAVFCWVRLREEKGDPTCREMWLESGMHAANGVSTLALTYTLLGISLGIGSMAEQELTPLTIQLVIQGLTEHFSLAFLTTVIGLPVSAVLRALLQITASRINVKLINQSTPYAGE